jgi:hypothetical protein
MIGMAARWMAAVLLTMPLLAAAEGPAPTEQTRVAVVYHFDAGLEQASRGLRNIRNHLAADPGVHITAVALGSGVDFLLKGAKSADGQPFDVIVEELQMEGVRFKACNNTLRGRSIDKGRLLDEVEIVPAGVAELARLQVREGYAYIKP